MRHSKPTCLVLVFLLAFWTPVSVCCGMAGAESMDAASAGPAVPSCHAPRSSGVPSEPRTTTDPCDGSDCTCDAAQRACEAEPTETQVVPSSAGQLLSTLLTSAPLQPESLLPHTFFARHGGHEDLPTLLQAAPTLLALSCQLTV